MWTWKTIIGHQFFLKSLFVLLNRVLLFIDNLRAFTRWVHEMKKRESSFFRFWKICVKKILRKNFYTERNLPMRSVAQTVFPFKLEEEKDLKLTSHAGLPLVHELIHRMSLPKLIRKHLKLKKKGWGEEELLEVLISLGVVGGDHMSDIEILKKDPAFLALIRKKNGLPSVKTVERFLKLFHEEQEKPEGVDAWVPLESKALKNLSKIHRTVTQKLIEKSGITTATIENDATIIFSHKEEALGTYKGGIGYAPVVGTIAELGLVLHDEFRDGNVPASFEVTSFFKKCLSVLPSTIKKVRTRLDGAYYNLEELIPYLKKQKIEFSITGKKSKSVIEWIEALPEGQWKPLMKITNSGLKPTGKEWVEMFWTSAAGTREQMQERSLRCLITRKSEHQWELFKKEFQSEVEEKDRYEMIVTNMEWQGDKLIRWHYERGGTIEHIHDRIKNDLAGGTLPCAEFGANAAWFRIQCLAWNLIRALQIHALPQNFSNCHLKRLRLWLFNIAGKVIWHGRQLILKLTEGNPSFPIYQEARLKIAALSFP